MKPHISVIIPLYNNEHSVKSTLDSACKQTIKNIEIIVIDDGSTDNGAEIVKRFPDPRIILYQQKNMGVSVSRNKGIEKSRADLVAFLDADDTWDTTYLETILRLKTNYPQAGAFATSYHIMNGKGKKETVKLKHITSTNWEGVLTNYFRLASLEKTPIFWTGSICVYKSVFEKIGGFCVGEHCGQDIDMWYRIALSYPIAYSASPKAYYHRDYVHENAFTKKRISKITTEMQYIKTLRSALSCNSLPSETNKYLSVLVDRGVMEMVKIHIINGNRHAAIKSIYFCNMAFLNKLYWTVLAVLPKVVFQQGFFVKLRLKRR